MKTMKLITTALAAIIMTAAGSVAQAAGSQELHRHPFTFLFGNHLDTHQETKLNNDGSLKGRLYIYFTGEINEAIAWRPFGAAFVHWLMGDPRNSVVC